MKIFIYPDTSGTGRILRAITANGDEVAASDSHVSDAPAEQLPMIKALQRAASDEYPDATYAWVDDPWAHPLLASLLMPPAEEDKEPNTTHLCGDCAHQQVCIAAEATAKIDATVTACEQHVALPTEDQP